MDITAADRVRAARDTDRPTAKDYIERLFTDFTELSGDRYAGEDSSITGGIAFFHGQSVTVLGQQKGRSLDENMKYRFGMPNPEGYRKAIRMMKQAEKFRRPVITLIDTPGAFPGKEAEERGAGEAIASSIETMSRLTVPVIAIFIGEGGSGGALALAAADRIVMLENSIFSILSPEGFASILWKDSSRWEEAAAAMKLTAGDLEELGVCDHLVPEYDGDWKRAYSELDNVVWKELQELMKLSSKELQKKRYKKFRDMGKRND